MLHRLAVAAPLLLATAAPAEFVVTADQADGVYDAGEDVTWTIDWRGDDAPESFDFTLRLDFLNEIESGTFQVGDKPRQVKMVNHPGHTAQIEVTAGEAREVVGVIMVPDKVEPVTGEPDDFDAFWAEQVDRIKAIPANAQLEPVETEFGAVEYAKITMDGIDGTKIQGQIAKPAEGDKFPALFIPQWAGVYGLQQDWVLGRAGDGWLVLNILAHDLPIDEPAEFYQQQNEGPLSNYPAIGNDSRETSYFLRMYLSCYQALDYLASRDDWNGEVLVVNGGSQGGMQALVSAALHPQVTAALANVPAGCDMTGPDSGRAPGWPMWYWQAQGKDADAVHQASRYFDVVNFAEDITVPVLVGVGLEDNVCPPAGITAAVNEMAGPVEVVYLPQSGHMNTDNVQAAYYAREHAWLQSLRDGKAAPVDN